jgi:hypothetical protein
LGKKKKMFDNWCGLLGTSSLKEEMWVPPEPEEEWSWVPMGLDTKNNHAGKCQQ